MKFISKSTLIDIAETRYIFTTEDSAYKKFAELSAGKVIKYIDVDQYIKVAELENSLLVIEKSAIC